MIFLLGKSISALQDWNQSAQRCDGLSVAGVGMGVGALGLAAAMSLFGDLVHASSAPESGGAGCRGLVSQSSSDGSKGDGAESLVAFPRPLQLCNNPNMAVKSW